MEKYALENIEAYLLGALNEETNYDSDHMKGYFAAIRNVKAHLDFCKECFGLTPAEE